MKSAILTIAAGALLGGCQSYEGAFSRPMLSRMTLSRDVVPPVSPSTTELPRDFICDLPGGTRLGGNRVTVLSGEYVVHGSDNQGVFWRHGTRGIIRSGNLSRVEEGGIYCPLNPEQRCLMWIVPKDQGSLLLGAAVLIPQGPEPDRFAIYVGDVPAEISKEVRRYFPQKEEPNKAPEPTPGSVTPRADARAAPAGVVAHL